MSKNINNVNRRLYHEKKYIITQLPVVQHVMGLELSMEDQLKAKHAVFVEERVKYLALTVIIKQIMKILEVYNEKKHINSPYWTYGSVFKYIWMYRWNSF